MSDFHFLRPDWFFALPPLLLLLWLFWRRRLRSRNWQEVCDPELLPYLLVGRSRRRSHWPLWLRLISSLLAVTALAGPTWRRLPQPLFRQQSALVVALDLSRSMLAADLKPNRLVRARLKIRDILRQRREGVCALLVFAGDAFAITPLTDDNQTIEALLSALHPDLMPVQGSDPSRAFELAGELLQQAGVERASLLLVTDEDRPERAVAAAKRLPQQGLRLEILGVGSSDGAPIPLADGGFFKDQEGNLVLPRLNETGLKQLATAGGGSYRRIRIDDGDFQDLLADLDSHRLDQAEQLKKRLGDQWQEAGIWLLWLLLLPAAAAFRRGWLTVLILGLLLPAQAEAWNGMELWQRPDQLGKTAFDAGQYERASGHFQDPRWKASSLYRAGRYDEVLKTLPEDKTADDWYNRGNALARCGRLQEALAAYDQALKLNPQDEDSQINRQLVAEALKQQQSPENPPPRENLPGRQAAPADAKESGADQPPKEQNGTDGQRSQQQAAEAQPEQGARQPAETAAEPAAAAQQDKDAAAGQGAQLSSRQQDTAGQAPAAATPTETALEDAEKQQLRQQLQAIPDDPGGLLRRKFLYQYRRRGQQRETDRPW